MVQEPGNLQSVGEILQIAFDHPTSDSRLNAVNLFEFAITRNVETSITAIGRQQPGVFFMAVGAIHRPLIQPILDGRALGFFGMFDNCL